MRIYIFIFCVITCLFGCASVKELRIAESRTDSLQLQLQTSQNEAMELQQRLVAVEDSVFVLNHKLVRLPLETEYQTYKTAVTSGDHQLAAHSMAKILVLDTAQAWWICDSLALYHYLYLMTPGVPRQSKTALYYTEMGLRRDPANRFLREMYGKLQLELVNDSAAYKAFRSLWEEYGDYTYLWEMTFMDLYVFENLKRTESVIQTVLSSKDAIVKMVRIEQTEERKIEEIPAKAAFMYLRSVMQAAKGQAAAAKKTMEEVVKLAPGFKTAQRALYQMTGQRY